MQRLFDSSQQILIRSHDVYLPLVYDPHIKEEVQGCESVPGESKSIVRFAGVYFIKSFDIFSLVRNYRSLAPRDYERLKREVFEKYRLTPHAHDALLDEKLKILLFRVMPHFIRSSKISFAGRRAKKEGVLDTIGERLHVPERYYRQAQDFMDTRQMLRSLKKIEGKKRFLQPPGDGMISGRDFRQWLYRALSDRILAEQAGGLKRALSMRSQFQEVKAKHLAALMYITDTGKLEIDGFGIIRQEPGKEYLVYKRTGEYVLKDYYARSYRFPDCRVAVSTYVPNRPMVLDKYKHPFLNGFHARQEICLKDCTSPGEFSAEAIIRGIEDGIAALLYGYDPRQRNGYHSLDRTWVHLPTIDFEDYRIREKTEAFHEKRAD